MSTSALTSGATIEAFFFFNATATTEISTLSLHDALPIFTARPSGISFEASNPRHAHEWRVFEHVRLPDGKVLIPGVLDSTTNFIEHPDLVAERIGRYARLVGRENVV